MTELLLKSPPIATFIEDVKGSRHKISGLENEGQKLALDWSKLPSKKDEEWRYLNLNRLYDIAWDSATKINPDVNLVKSHLESLPFYSAEGNHLVFVNGSFQDALSKIIPSGGISIGNLHSNNSAIDKFGQEHLTIEDSHKNDLFSNLNSSILDDGLYLNIKTGKSSSRVYTYQITTGDLALTVHPRNILSVEDNGEGDVTEYFAHLGTSSSWFNPITQIQLCRNSRLRHTLLQTSASLDFYTGHIFVQQKDSSNFNQSTFTFEGSIIRNNLELILDGSGIEGNMLGLYMLDGATTADNHTLVDHRKPNSVSNELYKGIMDGSSTGIFNGKIFVRQNAQKTNAYQNNKNILLNGNATVDTKPQLEIYADDVKCSHGATSGQLDNESLFYLRSRGLSLEEAKALLTKAFAAEIVEKLEDEKVGNYLNLLIENRFRK